jgi:hypothetical protein
LLDCCHGAYRELRGSVDLLVGEITECPSTSPEL